MNDKGQALVEFVLVLPVLILIIFAIIEVGNLIHQKYNLETQVDHIIELYKDSSELIPLYETKENIKINFEKSGDLVKVTVTKDVKLVTPGVNKLLPDPYKLKVERSFYVNE